MQIRNGIAVSLIALSLMAGFACTATGAQPVESMLLSSGRLEKAIPLGREDQRITARTVSYYVEDVGEGDEYEIFLNLDITLAAGSGAGYVMITGSTHECVGALLNLHVRQNAHGEPVATWNSTGLIDGATGGPFAGRRGHIEFRNYLPACRSAIEDGVNDLTFTLEKFGKVRVARVMVLPGSGIEQSDLEPAELELEPELSDEDPAVGRPFAIAFDLKNLGDRSAHDVRVSVESSSKQLVPVGREEYRFANLQGSAAGRFVFRAKRRDEYKLEIKASSRNTDPSVVVVEANIGTGGDRDGGTPVWILIAGWTALIWGIAFFIWRRRRAR